MSYMYVVIHVYTYMYVHSMYMYLRVYTYMYEYIADITFMETAIAWLHGVTYMYVHVLHVMNLLGIQHNLLEELHATTIFYKHKH